MKLIPLTAVAMAALGCMAAPQLEKRDYTISWEEAYAKAEKLVSKMSLEQKVVLPTGVGDQKGFCEGYTAGVDGLFPALCLNDGPLGLRRASGVSVQVTALNAAASFDRKLIRERGVNMGEEYRGKGVNVQLGPGMNLMRSPRAGRNWEMGTEDPFLMGVLAAETIKGVQSQGVMSVAKHFIGNEQELNRHLYSTDMDDRTMHELYLWPFARSVEAGVVSVMCAYNQVNGTYACEDDYTLNHVLKGELGFKGYVMSDWWATHSTDKSAMHGMDMSMPGDANADSITGGGLWYGKNLTEAVKDGRVDEDRVNDMALRIAAAWYKVGQDKHFPELQFDFYNVSNSPIVDVQGDHRKNIRALGAASAVLLRNEDNILPLQPSSIKKLAVIGSDAGPDPDGLNPCQDNSCANGTLAQGWGSGSASFPYKITPLDGLEFRTPSSVEIVSHLDDWDTDSAAKVAEDADIALVFANSNSGEEYITVAGNVGDRNNMSLWHNGDNLIKAVADANKNTVVVIHSVGAIDMPWIDHPNIKALVFAGLPGQETGNSLADVLYGDVNPSGRLTYTIAKQESDYSANISSSMVIKYNEGMLVGYRHFDAKDIDPLFEFGFGLSYTQFKYSNLKIHAKGDTVTVSAKVKNTGDRDGAEIVQLYLGFPESAGEPPKNLRGFEKVEIGRGGSATVEMQLSKTELSIWNTSEQAWEIPRGTFTVYIGASSRDIRLHDTFDI